MYECHFCQKGFLVGWRLEFNYNGTLRIVYCCSACKEEEKYKKILREDL